LKSGNRHLVLNCINDISVLLDRLVDSDTNLILFEDGSLGESFFDLSTGVAGELFQKVCNYHLKIAAVVRFDEIKSKRFQELILECSRGGSVRFFEERDAAFKWLMK
jgi:hypothetical protein